MRKRDRVGFLMVVTNKNSNGESFLTACGLQSMKLKHCTSCCQACEAGVSIAYNYLLMRMPRLREGSWPKPGLADVSPFSYLARSYLLRVFSVKYDQIQSVQR